MSWAKRACRLQRRRHARVVEGHRAVALQDDQLEVAPAQRAERGLRRGRERRLERGGGRQHARRATRQQRGAQQHGLACVGRRHRVGHEMPREARDGAGEMGRDRHHRQRGDGPGPACTQRVECRHARQHAERPADRDEEAGEDRHQHRHEGDADPPRIVARRHPQEGRDLLAVPVEVDGAAEQCGHGDVEVAAEHHAEVAGGEPRERAVRRRPAPRHRAQQQDPQRDELRRQPRVGQDGRRGPPVAHREQRVEQRECGQGGQGAARRQGMRHRRRRDVVVGPWAHRSRADQVAPPVAAGHVGSSGVTARRAGAVRGTSAAISRPLAR